MHNDDLLIEISQRLQDDYQFKPTQDGKTERPREPLL